MKTSRGMYFVQFVINMLVSTVMLVFYKFKGLKSVYYIIEQVDRIYFNAFNGFLVNECVATDTYMIRYLGDMLTVRYKHFINFSFLQNKTVLGFTTRSCQQTRKSI